MNIVAVDIFCRASVDCFSSSCSWFALIPFLVWLVPIIMLFLSLMFS